MENFPTTVLEEKTHVESTVFCKHSKCFGCLPNNLNLGNDYI